MSAPAGFQQSYFAGIAGMFRLAFWRNRIERRARQEMEKVDPQAMFEIPVGRLGRFQPGNSSIVVAERNCTCFAQALNDELNTDGYRLTDGSSISISARYSSANGQLKKFSLAVTLT